MLTKANEMKAVVYIKKFPESEIVKNALAGLNDKEKELISEISLKKDGAYIGKYKLDSDKKVVEENKKLTDEYKSAWVKLQTILQEVTGKLNAKSEVTPIVPASPAPTAPIEPPVAPVPPVAPAPVQRTRLSKQSLEALLGNIEKLTELDNLYLSSDDEIPGDIDAQISELEAKIEQDKHLLKKAMSSSTNSYHVYKVRIIEAEKAIKKHRISYDNRKNIRITV